MDPEKGKKVHELTNPGFMLSISVLKKRNFVMESYTFEQEMRSLSLLVTNSMT